MGILSVSEKQGQGARTGSINALYQRTYQRVFIVETDDPRTGIFAVRTAPGVPQVGAFYQVLAGDGVTVLEFDRGSFVNTVTPAETSDDGTAWEVTVAYGPYSPETFPQDPIDWPIRLSWGNQTYDKPVSEDIHGNPIVNSAGVGFAEPPVVDDDRSILTVTRNEPVKAVPANYDVFPPTPARAAFDTTLAKQYKGKTNQYAWNGAAAGTVVCKTIVAGDAIQSPDGVWYYAVKYVFQEDANGWKKRLLDQGRSAIDSSGKVRQIKGKDGQPVNEDVPLDGSGKVLAAGADPVYLEFEVLEEIDFTDLNIDLSTALGAS